MLSIPMYYQLAIFILVLYVNTYRTMLIHIELFVYMLIHVEPVYSF